MEIWKDIKGYEGIYQISNLGRIKNCKGIVKKLQRDKDGYLRTNLYKGKQIKTIFAHRAVALAFINNPYKKAEVNHIDGNKENNSVENLEWCTKSENEKHAYKNRLKIPKKGKESPSFQKYNNIVTSKSVIQFDFNGNCLNIYPSMHEASRQTKVHVRSISYCCSGKYKTAGGYIWRYNIAHMNRHVKRWFLNDS